MNTQHRFDPLLAVSPYYFDVCNKDLQGFKNLAGLATLPVITKLTVY